MRAATPRMRHYRKRRRAPARWPTGPRPGRTVPAIRGAEWLDGWAFSSSFTLLFNTISVNERAGLLPGAGLLIERIVSARSQRPSRLTLGSGAHAWQSCIENFAVQVAG